MIMLIENEVLQSVGLTENVSKINLSRLNTIEQ